MKKQSQKEKVLSIWVQGQAKDTERWFYPYDFIQYHELFIGYKAPTRFCEMCLEYTELIETKMDGKYRIGRLRLDNIDAALGTLPYGLRDILTTELIAAGLKEADKIMTSGISCEACGTALDCQECVSMGIPMYCTEYCAYARGADESQVCSHV